MYPVSDAFMDAVESNTRKYYWTGTIVTKNKKAYSFGNEDIVKGSGYITRQCCGSSEIELGSRLLHGAFSSQQVPSPAAIL